MSLRTKLLLLSLLTLVLPWAGWLYATQMETTLRLGQEAALLTTADVLSRVVASQPELLYRSGELREQFDAARGDLFAPLATSEPLIDGFPDEWPQPSRIVPGFNRSDASPMNAPLVRAAVHGRSLHMYVDVLAARIRFETPRAHFAERIDADRLIVLTRDEFGRERAWSISAVAPGPIIVRPCGVGAPWAPLEEPVSTLAGVWRQTSTGYAVELRGPVNLFGTQLSVHALDAAGRAYSQSTLAWLHTGSELLRQRLEQYAPEGVRVSVVDVNGWLLARAGSLAVDAAHARYPGLQEDADGFTRSIYRVLFGRNQTPVRPYGLPYGMWGPPVDEARAGEMRAIWFEPGGGEPSVVRAAVPVHIESQTLGALIVEQPGEQLALVRELALTRLLNLTFVATLFMVAVTLIFAARLSQRIRRLARAAATALTPEGRIEPSIPDTSAADELGALARSYDQLLNRLKEYTNYLQTLGGKLSHELRTPLTIVSSSLENLASEERLPEDARNYLARAREGARRAHAILTAMSEATRVEQSIEHTERVKFDLAAVVRNMAQAYGQSFPQQRIEAHTPEGACTVLGSPELIAQMLDKLLENAADFAPAGALIAIELEHDAHHCRLRVRNEGPLLPSHIDARIFESLVSGRERSGAKPHLGLGLYIVRLIAEFHRGSVRAENLPDLSGVVFTAELPCTA